MKKQVKCNSSLPVGPSGNLPKCQFSDLGVTLDAFPWHPSSNSSANPVGRTFERLGIQGTGAAFLSLDYASGLLPIPCFLHAHLWAILHKADRVSLTAWTRSCPDLMQTLANTLHPGNKYTKSWALYTKPYVIWPPRTSLISFSRNGSHPSSVCIS